MRTIYAYATSLFLSASAALANPCVEVTRVQQALATGFASETTRKDGATEKLAVPLFGEPACAIHRPIGVLTKRWIICTINQVTGDDDDDRAFAKTQFDALADTLKRCLPSHIAFDNRANEDPLDEIFDRRHYRSADGRETWSLTLEDENVPSAVIVAELESDGTAPAASAPAPVWLGNVLEARACQLYDQMADLARTDFAGVEIKRVRTENAMVKPIGGADQCLVARDSMRKENIIACTWTNVTPEHAKWAADTQAIRLKAARSCYRNWRETAKTFEIEFAKPSGDKLSIGTRSGPDLSVTGVAVTVKIAP